MGKLTTVWLGALLLSPGGIKAQNAASFEVFEATIPQLQSALTAKRVSSAQLVDAYLRRISAFDTHGPRLNAMIRLNPSARRDAAALDAERSAGRVRGPLHGIPIILKDNYDTEGLETSGGSVALAGLVPTRDAFQVRKLREAGAIILGKANLHELAAGIVSISSLGGQTRNPYDPTRNPGGSSGGTGAAVAASFAAIAWGSDTCGSIRIPAAFHNLFGLRPTKGLSSIDGIIPLAHTQDVAGPLARTVTDLAIGLDATIGADPNDPATRILDGVALPRFMAALDTGALRGLRIGVLTSGFGSQPEDQEVTRLVRASLDRIKERGAEVVDVPTTLLDSLAARAGVINYEFKFDLMDYLAARPNAPVKSLGEILERGLYHSELEATFRNRNATAERNSAPYQLALARRDTTRAEVIALLERERLDVLVYPTVRRKPATIGEIQRGGNCQLSAVTGLPALSMPAGFTNDGLPIGFELLGRPLSDARLVAIAYAYEQAVKPRRPPASTPALGQAATAASVVMTIKTTGPGAVRAAGTFTYHASLNTLSYSVRVTGVARERVHAIVLSRSVAEGKGPVLIRLAGPGVDSAAGVWTLTESERNDLKAGRLVLNVFTRDHPHGAMNAVLRWPR